MEMFFNLHFDHNIFVVVAIKLDPIYVVANIFVCILCVSHTGIKKHFDPCYLSYQQHLAPVGQKRLSPLAFQMLNTYRLFA